MHDLPTGPGGSNAFSSVSARAPYDAIERGSFLFGDNFPDKNVVKENKVEIHITPGLENNVVIPVNSNGNLMSPVERSTGIPLPILPSEQEMSREDEHHTYFYKDWYQGSLAGSALRYTRIQRVGREDHDRYHERFDGTLPPATEQELFRIMIMNCAGYVPAFGVQVSEEKTHIRPLRHHEQQALREPGTFYPEYHDESVHNTNDLIGRFIMNYALTHSLHTVSKEEVGRFLSISRESARRDKDLKTRKFEMGMQIVSKLLSSAVSSFREDFDRARQTSSLMPNPMNECPATVAHAQVKHFRRSMIKNLHHEMGLRVAN